MTAFSLVKLATAATAVAILSTGAVYAQAAKPPVLTHVPRTPNDPGGNSSPMIHHGNPFEVCFYSGVKFTQQHFCVDDEERIGFVEPEWRHRIKSIKVIGEDIPNVKVCSEGSLTGQCLYVDFYKEQLPQGLFDHVYSYRIR